MLKIKPYLLVLTCTIVLFLGACSNTETSNSSNNSPETSANASPTKKLENTNKTEEKAHDSTPLKGGQVIESGPYHLEFVPAKESGGVHLDFYLQKGDNHEPIPDAKITAQIQLPDGTAKTLDLVYKAQEKHYAALLSETSKGQYQVKITADINGEKVDGRFSFNQ
jgi:hypothetical protein